MSTVSRDFPEQPSLRYLKIEAKRRLGAGEFPTLHEAQLAIAREHGLPSWAALKTAIEGESNPALVQVRWIIARFRGADQPAWVAPAEDEIRAHFDEQYLGLVAPEALVKTLRSVAGQLRQDLTATAATAVSVRARVGGLRVEAAVEPAAPGRLTGLRIYPIAQGVTDRRLAEAPRETAGPVPAEAVAVIEEAYAELAPVGLAVAGSLPRPWTAAYGWADLDRDERLVPGHRFPVYGTTKVVTSTAVLCLVAAGRLALDAPADTYLRTVRLADPDVTVRQLLSHTDGVDSPDAVFAEETPEQIALLGTTVSCGGTRGRFRPGNGGYAILGELIAGVTGVPYPDAVRDLVLDPLGMAESSFPRRWPQDGAVTGYELSDEDGLRPAPRQVSTMPAAGGLWTTAVDLARFGANWQSLLSAELAAEALAAGSASTGGPDNGVRVGLGWLVNRPKGIYGHLGAGPGAATSLVIGLDSGPVVTACATRRVSMESVAARLLRPIA